MDIRSAKFAIQASFSLCMECLLVRSVKWESILLKDQRPVKLAMWGLKAILEEKDAWIVAQVTSRTVDIVDHVPLEVLVRPANLARAHCASQDTQLLRKVKTIHVDVSPIASLARMPMLESTLLRVFVLLAQQGLFSHFFKSLSVNFAPQENFQILLDLPHVNSVNTTFSTMLPVRRLVLLAKMVPTR